MKKKVTPKQVDSVKESILIRFITFPDRINNFTKILIIVLYLLLVILTLTFAFPKRLYVTIPSFPDAMYNEEIDAHLYIQSQPTRTEKTKTEKGKDVKYEVIEMNRNFTFHARRMNDFRPVNIIFATSALRSDGLMEYLYEITKSGRTAPTQSSTTEYNTNDISYENYFMRIKYDLEKTEKTEAATNKLLEISIKNIGLSKKELSSDKFTNINQNNKVKLWYEFRANSTTENADQLELRFLPLVLTEDYTVNLQVYLVTARKEIIPVFGLYNYSTKAEYRPSYHNTIYNNIEAEYFYAIVHYTTKDGKTSSLYYKEAYSDMKALYTTN